ncbi:D-alanyl-D-alanine carboxypeptidase family protein [Paenibacillus lemnae]|uniref:D-alanyl-D-alanine carboxypeptidase n=1 Tax=Paenibacillus lemnae TaxID=1330551 RepID=A0A848M079_PAELE|nr:D-alanyl-D-alanine carboxypeptidase family protein [Paenibacillus lemnae]NMO94207.1 D-alanyl-D-alanine carboxypeptidase [Paenibacillus lemnae]
MKNRWLWIVILILCMIPAGLFLTANIEPVGREPEVEAKAVVLIDADSGRILFSRNGDTPLPPASMSKLMTELLILDEIKAGHLNWDEGVVVNRHASHAKGVRLPLQEGDVLTVRELFQSLAVYSADDAAAALAEHTAGSQDRFIQEMNRKAKELGLSNQTFFQKKAGIAETTMTAKDTARLAAHLISQYPEVLNTSSKTQIKLAGRDVYLSSSNWMLPSLAGPYSYEGTDGLKAGFSEQAGYCFTGTAEQGGTRLIAVVLGADSREARFEETRKLFDYGFTKSLTWKERLNHWFREDPVSAALSR